MAGLPQIEPQVEIRRVTTDCSTGVYTCTRDVGLSPRRVKNITNLDGGPLGVKGPVAHGAPSEPYSSSEALVTLWAPRFY
jgi:hypothetical protein